MLQKRWREAVAALQRALPLAHPRLAHASLRINAVATLILKS